MLQKVDAFDVNSKTMQKSASYEKCSLNSGDIFEIKSLLATFYLGAYNLHLFHEYLCSITF